jgi:putative flippase GtrA
MIWCRQMLKEKLERKFFIFLLVGLLNTLFGYSIFALLVFLGLHYALAVLIATCLGILFNFKTTGALVFGSRDNSLIGRFVAVYAVLCLANIALLKMMLEIGLGAYAGGAVVVFPLAVVGYLLNLKFVFVDKK